MKQKSFTLKEANKLVPKIKISFDAIFVLKKKIAAIKMEADWLREFWGDDLHDSDNPDSDKVDEIEWTMEALHADIVSQVQKIESFGCVLKDIDNGLVDFLSVVNGQAIFLCWRYGEPRIQYWHPTDGGFRGRQPLGPMDKIE